MPTNQQIPWWQQYPQAASGLSPEGRQILQNQWQAQQQQARATQSQTPQPVSQPGGAPVYGTGSSAGAYPTSPMIDLNPMQHISQGVNWQLRTISGQPGQPGWQYTYDPVPFRHVNSDAIFSDMISEYTRAMNEGRQVNEQRYADILGGYRDLRDEAGQMHSQRQASLQQNLDQDLARVTQGHQNRYDAGMQLLQGMGGQEAQRINRDFHNQQAGMGADLARRGLNTSSISHSMGQGIERNRQEAKGDLSDQMRREKLAAHMGFSGDALGAEQQQRQFRTGMMDRAAQGRMQDMTNIPRDTLSFMERREDTYPSLDQLTQLASVLGQSQAGQMLLRRMGLVA